MLSNILCSQDNENVESIEPAKYESEMTLLTVNEQAINIQPKDLDKENLYLPLSARMGLWHHHRALQGAVGIHQPLAVCTEKKDFEEEKQQPLQRRRDGDYRNQAAGRTTDV